MDDGCWLQIHFRINAIDEGELARQAFAEEKAGDFAGFISLGHREAWQREPGRRFNQGDAFMNLSQR